MDNENIDNIIFIFVVIFLEGDLGGETILQKELEQFNDIEDTLDHGCDGK